MFCLYILISSKQCFFDLIVWIQRNGHFNSTKFYPQYIIWNCLECCRYCNTLMLYLNKPFFAIIIIGVSSMSVCLFRVSDVLHIALHVFIQSLNEHVNDLLKITILQLLQSLIAYNDIGEIFLSVAFLLVHVCYIFLGNHIGQQITNNNAEIFVTVWVPIRLCRFICLTEI